MSIVVVASVACTVPYALSSLTFVLQLVIIISMLHASSCCCIACQVPSLRTSLATHCSVYNLNKKNKVEQKKIDRQFYFFFRVFQSQLLDSKFYQSIQV